MHAHRSLKQSAAYRAEHIYKRLRTMEERFRSLRGCDYRLKELRNEINYTEQKLYDIQKYAIKEVKCISISLLKMIQENVPEAQILTEFADLLAQEEEWRKDVSGYEHCYEC
ncbi:MAG: hypothetical protein H6850_00480 [Alphaproteobacteria bacterium]|nr:MAG: hypothetical protein H6850_00480 [Alphaproteobacteria bacterium]